MSATRRAGRQPERASPPAPSRRQTFSAVPATSRDVSRNDGQGWWGGGQARDTFYQEGCQNEVASGTDASAVAAYGTAPPSPLAPTRRLVARRRLEGGLLARSSAMLLSREVDVAMCCFTARWMIVCSAMRSALDEERVHSSEAVPDTPVLCPTTRRCWRAPSTIPPPPVRPSRAHQEQRCSTAQPE